MANNEIRTFAKEKGVFLWRVADSLGVCDMTLTRKLRHELSQEEKEKIRAIINELSKKGA